MYIIKTEVNLKALISALERGEIVITCVIDLLDIIVSDKLRRMYNLRICFEETIRIKKTAFEPVTEYFIFCT
jgi:hypothetical protein